ncbi:MAG: fatty acid desaturase [Pseudomonadota bacterium]
MTDTTHTPDNRFFALSAADAWLIGVSALGIGLLALATAFVPVWPVWVSLLLFLFMCFVICTNYQCVGHNFVHNEFFNSSILNTLFSMMNSMALGFPQTIFNQHHMNHHRFNNAPFARDGSPGDLSSLQRYSDGPGVDEPFLKYCLLSPLRADVISYGRSAIRRGLGKRLALDVASLLVLMSVLAVIDWRFFLFFYLPLVYFGHVLTYAEGYFEHHKTVPGDKMRNAVSSYGRFYNFIWFNNGFHQEHHCYPQVHWTQIPAYRDRMLPDQDRRVVPFAHWVNF